LGSDISINSGRAFAYNTRWIVSFAEYLGFADEATLKSVNSADKGESRLFSVH